MATIAAIFTYGDLAQLPDDGKRYEIVEGELLVSPAPTTAHQQIVDNVMALLRRARELGYGRGYVAPIDVVLDTHNVVQPDACFIRQDRLDIVTIANIQGAPDLVVEVLSPVSRERDLGVKARLYARFGVSHYWTIDPDSQTVRTFALSDAGYTEAPPAHPGDTLGIPLFPDLPVAVSDIFA